jgi:hypothetical protein
MNIPVMSVVVDTAVLHNNFDASNALPCFHWEWRALDIERDLKLVRGGRSLRCLYKAALLVLCLAILQSIICCALLILVHLNIPRPFYCTCTKPQDSRPLELLKRMPPV